jgi:hypothetical protein
LPARHHWRANGEALLGKVRAAKASWLNQHPDVLRKSSRLPSPPAPSWRGLPVDTIAAEALVKAARDRVAEEQRLGKPDAGPRRYVAPDHLRGRAVCLNSGGTVDVPDNGFCSPKGTAAHPGYGPSTETAMHRELVALGFRELPNNPDNALVGEDAMTTMKAALHRPIVGDRGLISFLNRHAVR